MAPEQLSADSVAAARANGTPVLFFDTRKKDIDSIGAVVTDNYDACKTVTARLIGNGFSKIVVLLPEQCIPPPTNAGRAASILRRNSAARKR